MSVEKIISESMVTKYRTIDVTGAELDFTYILINGRIICQGENLGKNIVFKDETQECNLVNEMLYRCPMYANFLMSRKYNNILFVPHMDINETKWYMDAREYNEIDPQTLIDGYPPEKLANRNYPDLDKVLHFIPVFMRTWEYDVQVTVARPPQARYSGVIHQIYDRFHLNNVITNTQYEHGENSLHIENRDVGVAKFDAVVFLNVPSKNNQSFTLDTVKEQFAEFVTDDCHFIDIWNGDTSNRFLNGYKLPISGNIMEMIEAKRESGGTDLRSEDMFFNRHIHAYR